MKVTEQTKVVDYIIGELSKEELMLLYLMTNRIGGPPEGPRGFFDQLRSKIREVISVEFINSEDFLDSNRKERDNNSIYFNDDPNWKEKFKKCG